jgi:Cys-tRNA(Pro)/Cys-tRNA(Cys) deacylase
VSGRGTPALDAVRAAGVAHVVHAYEAPGPASPQDRDRRPQYGPDAAAALGLDPARVFKTLIASVDGRLAAAVVPVAHELDLKALAAALGGRKAALADPAEAQRATGYVVGGISPLGARRRLPAVLDASAGGFDTVFVSGGRRGLQLELAPADLTRLTGAIVAPISRPD